MPRLNVVRFAVVIVRIIVGIVIISTTSAWMTMPAERTITPLAVPGMDLVKIRILYLELFQVRH